MKNKADDSKICFANHLERAVQKGFVLTTTRIFFGHQLRSLKTNLINLISLVFCDENPPNVHWYKSKDSRFIHVSNQLITSVMFTGEVHKPHYEWTHCLLSFVHVPPTVLPSGNTVYTPYTTVYNPNSRTQDDSKEEEAQQSSNDLNINVQVCWMHHLDVYLFMRDCVGLDGVQIDD
jgi:hypothetical protein